jgi:hypothetical protein
MSVLTAIASGSFERIDIVVDPNITLSPTQPLLLQSTMLSDSVEEEVDLDITLSPTQPPLLQSTMLSHSEEEVDPTQPLLLQSTMLSDSVEEEVDLDITLSPTQPPLLQSTMLSHSEEEVAPTQPQLLQSTMLSDSVEEEVDLDITLSPTQAPLLQSTMLSHSEEEVNPTQPLLLQSTMLSDSEEEVDPTQPLLLQSTMLSDSVEEVGEIIQDKHNSHQGRKKIPKSKNRPSIRKSNRGATSCHISHEISPDKNTLSVSAEIAILMEDWSYVYVANSQFRQRKRPGASKKKCMDTNKHVSFILEDFLTLSECVYSHHLLLQAANEICALCAVIDMTNNTDGWEVLHNNEGNINAYL